MYRSAATRETSNFAVDLAIAERLWKISDQLAISRVELLTQLLAYVLDHYEIGRDRNNITLTPKNGEASTPARRRKR